MKYLPRHRSMLFLAAVLMTGAWWGQKNNAQPQRGAPDTHAAAPLLPVQRFEGKAVLKLKTGRAQELPGALRSWGIHGQQHVAKFPEQGFLVVHLHSGKVVTVVNGKEQQRKGGDFWTVPAGATMSVQVKSESAVLQTLAMKK